MIELSEAKVQKYIVEGFLVDTESVDDSKMAIILEGLAEQTNLKRISLLNCSIGEKTLPIL